MFKILKQKNFLKHIATHHLPVALAIIVLAFLVIYTLNKKVPIFGQNPNDIVYVSSSSTSEELAAAGCTGFDGGTNTCIPQSPLLVNNTSVSGGTSNSVLYVDIDSSLATSPNFTFTGNDTVNISGALAFVGIDEPSLAPLGEGKIYFDSNLGKFMVSKNDGPYAPLGGGDGGSSWSLTGNPGTIDKTNFIGTTDNTPLTFKVNDQLAGRIDSVLANTFFGYQSGNSSSITNNGAENTANGYQSLYSITTGNRNTANGVYALKSNTTGYDNTATGYKALFSITTGIYNTANGSFALKQDQDGSNNTAIGYNALAANDGGSNNTAIGTQAGNSTGGDGNVFIGYQAGYNVIGSNILVIDNQSRADEATMSLIYGVFNGDSSLQKLTINGKLNVSQVPTYADNIAVNAAIIAGLLNVGDIYTITGNPAVLIVQ